MESEWQAYGLERLRVERLGARGGHLVLLHGWGFSGQSLRPLAELLACDFQVHLIDLPGFGGSPVPTGTWGTEQYEGLIVGYLASQQITCAVLVGHSFGGRISIRIAGQHPQLVSRLALIASHGVPPVRPLAKQLRIKCIGLIRSLCRLCDQSLGTKIYSTWFIPRFASPDYKNAGALRSTFVRLVNEDLSPFLAKITAPTILLYGDKDTETPIALGQRIASLIKQATFVSLPGKDHEPYKDVGSHLIVTILRPFLLPTLSKETAP